MSKRKAKLSQRKSHREKAPDVTNEFSKGLYFSPSYQHIRFCSHRELKAIPSNKWLKLEPEVQRVLLLYQVQDKYWKTINHPTPPSVTAEIKRLEETNSLGEWAPLMDTPSKVDPITNKRISKKALRAQKKLEAHKEGILKEKSKKASSPITPEIEKLLKEKQNASPERQRKIRKELRKIGYHLSKV